MSESSSKQSLEPLRPIRRTRILFTFTFEGKRRQRHCGPDCYDDTAGPESCRCICCGFNHGVGRKAAIRWTKRMIERWIATWRPTRHWICDEVKQMRLFEDNGDGQ